MNNSLGTPTHESLNNLASRYINVKDLNNAIEERVKESMEPFVNKLASLLNAYESLITEKHEIEQLNVRMKYKLKDLETARVLNKQLTKENEFLKTELTSKNEVIKLIINERKTIEDIPLHATKSHEVNRRVVPNNSKTLQHDTPVNKNKNNKKEIIGDSLLNGLTDRGLSKNGNVKTRKISRCFNK